MDTLLIKIARVSVHWGHTRTLTLLWSLTFFVPLDLSLCSRQQSGNDRFLFSFDLTNLPCPDLPRTLLISNNQLINGHPAHKNSMSERPLRAHQNLNSSSISYLFCTSRLKLVIEWNYLPSHNGTRYMANRDIRWKKNINFFCFFIYSGNATSKLSMTFLEPYWYRTPGNKWILFS